MKCKHLLLAFILTAAALLTACQSNKTDSSSAIPTEEPLFSQSTGTALLWNSELSANELLAVDVLNGKASSLGSISRPAGAVCAFWAEQEQLAYLTVKNTDPSAAAYPVIADLNTHAEESYFDEPSYFQWVEGMCFLPQGDLIVTLSQGEQQEDSGIYRLNPQSGEISEIHRVVFDKDTPYTQTELDRLTADWGGQTKLSAEESNGAFYVRFSAPVLSPDRERLYYSATLCRTATPAYMAEDDSFPLLELSSGIWSVDLTLPQAIPELIYANPNPRTHIGGVVCSPDGKGLIFSEIGYTAPLTAAADIVRLDLASGTTETLLCHSEKLPMPQPRFFADANTLLLANGTDSYLLNTADGHLTPAEYSYNGQPITAERIFPIAN